MPPLVPVNPPQSTKDKAGSKPTPAAAASSKPAPKAKAKEEEEDDDGSDTMTELIPGSFRPSSFVFLDRLSIY